MTDTTTKDREVLAQETAEYIANVLMPAHAEATSGLEVVYINGNRPPTAVEDIKQTLLDGRVFISWIDDRVNAAMRALHGEPTGDVTDLLTGGEN